MLVIFRGPISTPTFCPSLHVSVILMDPVIVLLSGGSSELPQFSAGTPRIMAYDAEGMMVYDRRMS